MDRREVAETLLRLLAEQIAQEHQKIAQAWKIDLEVREITSLGPITGLGSPMAIVQDNRTTIVPERRIITVLEQPTTIGPRTITPLVLEEFHAQVPISLIAAKRDVQITRTDQQSQAAR